MRIVDVRQGAIDPARPAVVNVYVQGETPTEELAARPYRPVRLWQRAVADALLEAGFVPSTMTWSVNGCPCGCLQGFVLGGITGLQFLMLLDPEGADQFDQVHRHDVHVRQWQHLQLLADGLHAVE